MATVALSQMSAEAFWDWASLPEQEGQRYELDCGEVVAVPPPGEMHGVCCAWIAHLLWEYALHHGGTVCGNDTGLLLRRYPDTLRGVDVMLCAESFDGSTANRGFSERLPKLVVEVVSPSDSPGRINRRMSQYLARGIALIWLVDPEARIVTVYRPGADLRTVEETEEVTGEGVLPDLRVKVAALFGPSQRLKT